MVLFDFFLLLILSRFCMRGVDWIKLDLPKLGAHVTRAHYVKNESLLAAMQTYS